MALTDTFVRTVKAKDPPGQKYADGEGMYLFVTPARKYWRLDYRYLWQAQDACSWRIPTVSLPNPARGVPKPFEPALLATTGTVPVRATYEGGGGVGAALEVHCLAVLGETVDSPYSTLTGVEASVMVDISCGMRP